MDPQNHSHPPPSGLAGRGKDTEDVVSSFQVSEGNLHFSQMRYDRGCLCENQKLSVAWSGFGIVLFHRRLTSRLKWHIYPVLIHTVLHDYLRTDCGLTWTLRIYPVILFTMGLSQRTSPPHEQVQPEVTTRLLVLTALLHTNTQRQPKSSRKDNTHSLLSQLVTLQTWGPYDLLLVWM